MIFHFVTICLALELASCQILLPVIKKPRQLNKKVNMPKITNEDLEKAFEAGEMALQNKQKLENKLIVSGGIIQRDEKSPEATHQRSTRLSVGMGQPPDVTENIEGATAYLIKKYGLTRDQVIYGLPTAANLSEYMIGDIALEECRMLLEIIRQDILDEPCDAEDGYLTKFSDGKAPTKSKYRIINGVCNNVNNAAMGRTATALRRLLPPKYEDFIASPRRGLGGIELPSGRLISQTLLKEVDVQSKQYTHMLMQFGQFTDHDLTSSPTGSMGSYEMLFDCCKPDSQDQGFFPVHPHCLTIDIPANDPFYRKFPGKRCMNFIRSLAAPECRLGPRQQINMRTAALDGSNIYGSKHNENQGLRMQDFYEGPGALRPSFNHTFGELLTTLQLSMAGNGQCNIPENDMLDERRCFIAGDDRVNEQPGLTAMHTIWMRQHNRIGRILFELNPSYFREDSSTGDQFIFEESRRIVGAQLQYITYNEFLPIVLGDEYMKHFDLYPLKDGYTIYDPTKELSIFQEFSTSAFRFGHSLVHNEFKKVAFNGQTSWYNIKDKFFDPRDIIDGGLSAIMTGLYQLPAQQFDNHFSDSLVNHLYEEKGGKFGLDLIAINIQRGRDHGISSYTDYLEYCFDLKIVSFNDLSKVMNPLVAQDLSKVYKSPADIDLFVGGVSETPLPNAVVGPTFGCIIGLQFNQLKFSDRYYFEHGGQSGSFTPSQLSEIRKTSLARVICAYSNKTINAIQKRVMELPTVKNNPLVNCPSLPDLNLNQFPLPVSEPQMG